MEGELKSHIFRQASKVARLLKSERPHCRALKREHDMKLGGIHRVKYRFQTTKGSKGTTLRPRQHVQQLFLATTASPCYGW